MLRSLNNNDKEDVLRYLNDYQYEAAFMIGNINAVGIENEGITGRHGFYYGFFNNEGLNGVISFLRNGNCLLHYTDENAIHYFSRLIIDRYVNIILGFENIIDPVRMEIKKYKEEKEVKEGIFMINKNPVEYKIENAVFKDIRYFCDDNIIDFVSVAEKEGFGNILSRDRFLKSLEIKRESKDYDYLVMEMDGKYVAMSAVLAATKDINIIGAVETLSEERGKGYGKAITSEMIKRIAARGKTPALWVRKENGIAYNIYKKLGFENYNDFISIKY